MNKTKILATIGPASQSPTTIKRMIQAGMDAARLNFSHGDHRSHGEVIRRIRAAEKKTGKPITIHADLGGPKIRTGKLPNNMPVQLKAGGSITFAPERTARGDEIPVTFPDLAKDVKRGDLLLLDDGAISVRVKAVAGNRIKATVVDGGILREHKGINLPDVTLSTSAITKKDEDDLKFALSRNVDSVGISFVQGPDDIRRARRIMERAGRVVPIVAKIERKAALTNLEAIMKEADATMVARGDLGVETPLEDVPIIQRQIIGMGFELRKPVIVATQMLESMVEGARPTRAEASDVANSVLEGADVVMLSAETAMGCDPVNAVRTMDTIIKAAEHSRYIRRVPFIPDEGDTSAATATSRAACFAAEESQAQAILCFTMTGHSALLVSKQRPEAEIIAVAHTDDAVRRVGLYWGVRAIKVRRWKNIETMITRGVEAIKTARRITSGHKIVIVCGTQAAPGATNMMMVTEV